MFPVRDLKNVKQHVVIPVLAEDNSNISDFFRVDVAGNKGVPLNYGGWPRSDLALINAQTDMGVAKALANQVTVLPDSDQNAGLTDAEIMLNGKSKYAQSPAEYMRYIEQQIELRDSKILTEQRIQSQAKKVAAERAAEQELRDSLTPEEREEVRVAKRKKQINKLVK